MTTPIVFGRLHIVPVVVDFLKAYPDVDIQVRLVDRVINLLEEHVHLAFRIGDLPDSSLVATRIGSIGPVACASPAYLKAHGTPKHPKELAAHQCVAFLGMAAANEWPFRIDGMVEMFPVHACLAVTTAEAAIDAAIAGAGVTRVLCYQVARAVADGKLRIVLRNFEPEPFPASLIYPSRRLLPLKLRTFLDFATPRLKARLQPVK